MHKGNLFNYNLSLTFTEDGNCTVGSTSDDLIISGTGKFVKKGEKNSLGGKDRNAIYLDYTIDFKTKKHAVRHQRYVGVKQSCRTRWQVIRDRNKIVLSGINV